jgi:hypothetical protein
MSEHERPQHCAILVRHAKRNVCGEGVCVEDEDELRYFPRLHVSNSSPNIGVNSSVFGVLSSV